MAQLVLLALLVFITTVAGYSYAEKHLDNGKGAVAQIKVLYIFYNKRVGRDCIGIFINYHQSSYDRCFLAASLLIPLLKSFKLYFYTASSIACNNDLLWKKNKNMEKMWSESGARWSRFTSLGFTVFLLGPTTKILVFLGKDSSPNRDELPTMAASLRFFPLLRRGQRRHLLLSP